ncbi:hypothetical protein [Pseudonocardia parietis]|uniref:Membrane protein YqaA with SNARE-associated domain n=1 Tax=Pseudonocardia parietis TaxID=570936 RepID=A0ABS4W2M0_9PSEU|nr:hypothetical protein [Pseudonocardia parietis]MBP2370193.1 membrane protein YqaA with SNARE-associated domain [Pseudonocardia parietis]
MTELFWFGLLLGLVAGYYVGRFLAEVRAAKHDMQRRWHKRAEYRDWD